MEKLFEDLMMEEDERDPLAVHFLEGTVRIWCKTVQPNPSSGTAFPTWSTFRKMLFGAFFSDSVKQQLEDEPKNIKQGNRSAMEYQREFVRLENCVPFVIRDESHKARLFVDGLRGDISRLVQSADLHTFQQVVDSATLVERGAVLAPARSEGSDHNRDKKRSQTQSGGEQARGGRPPKYPRTQQGAKSPSTTGQKAGDMPCIICGGAHAVTACSQGQDHCFRCGKQGHFRSNCPLNQDSTSSAASMPSPQRQGRGRSSTAQVGLPPSTGGEGTTATAVAAVRWEDLLHGTAGY